jgi:hypothetical protein
MKKVYLIHGWGGSSKGDWFVWLKIELENRRYNVISPDMPDTFKPRIKNWVGHLKKIVKNPNKDTYFVGHSIGCQTIMRYLEQLDKDAKIGGVVFVAGWFNLSDETWDDIYTREIADEWLNTQIDFDKIKKHTNKFIAIFSDDDPYVPLSDKELFKKRLNAEIIVEHNKEHFSGEAGIFEVPVALNKILEISK